MNYYKQLYYELFNGITDTMEHLKKLQIDAEQKYIQSQEPHFHLSYIIKPFASSTALKKQHSGETSKQLEFSKRHE